MDNQLEQSPATIIGFALEHGFEPDAHEADIARARGFLLNAPRLSGEPNPNEAWTSLASSFVGRFKVPTLRDVDKRPRPDFVRAYMHNGYLKSLREVVHFYNTRDSLPT